MEKKILNESQLRNEIIKHLLENKIVSSRKDAERILDEGLFDKIKSGFSKLGSKIGSAVKGGLVGLGTITAGGKYFGQGKAKAAAQTQIDSELAKRGNKMIRDLDQKLKTQFKDEKYSFPNVKNKEQFIAGVEAIAQVYESIVAATKLKPGSKGYLGPKKANNIIKSLRMYVQKLIDYDLVSYYRAMNENDKKFFEKNKHILFEAATAGPLSGSKETETEKVFKSNKAPLTLLGIGTALGAFSWLVHTDWFKNLFATKSQIPVTKWVSQDSTKVLGAVQPGNGLTQVMNSTLGAKLSAASSPEELIKGLTKIGNGNAEKGIELLTQKGGLFPDSAGAKAALTDIVNNPHGHGDTLGQIFKGKIAGTGKEIGDVLVTKSGGAIVGAISKMVPKIAMMTAVKTGAGYAAAKGLGGVLGPLGLGLVAAGALVKAVRYKGLKSSRMATLKKLLTSLDDLAVPATVRKTKSKEQPEEVPTKNKKEQQPKQGGTQFVYSQPGSDKTTASYTVPGASPTFGNASATTTQPAPAAEPAKSTRKRASKPKQAGQASTEKKPRKKAKAETEPAKTTKPRVKSAEKAQTQTGNDYKRNTIGFNRELSEAFNILIKGLKRRNLI